MADVRVIPNVVLSDPTTPTQIAAVDASGRLSVSLTASSATVTVDSELSVAAALADGASNPTAGGVGAFLMLWNGATWDRGPGTTAGAFVQGNVAADTAVSARPLLGGGRASSAVPTAMSGDADAVHLWLDRSGGTIVNGRDVHDAALDANTNPQLIGGRSSTAAPASVSTDGDAVRAWFIANGSQTVTVTAAGALIGGDAANGLDVDVTRVTGTVTVDTELPAAAALSDTTGNPTTPMIGSATMIWDGSSNWLRARSAATLADALANPGAGLAQNQVFLMGYNGSTWDRVRTANTGRLQVDVITGGGADTPTSPVASYDTTATVTAGSTDNHDSADIGGLTRKLRKVVFSASVPLKAEVMTIVNGASTGTLAVGFTQAGTIGVLEPPHRDYWSTVFSANAGFDGFRVARTNLDASESADVYSTLFYET